LAPTRITLIFSAITPPERSAPLFWVNVLGAESLTLIKRYIKKALMVNWLNLLSDLITFSRSWYWFSKMPKRWVKAEIINLAPLS